MLKAIRCSQLLFCVLLFPALSYAQTTAPAAPVPAPITSAQKIFISNGGADAISQPAFKRAGQINEPYNSVYEAIKNWGHFQLLSTPDGADLVLEVRFTATMTDCGKLSTYAPQLELTILDGKTHFALWVLTQPVNGAYRKATWEKNYSDGVSGLVNQLKTLVVQPAH